MKDAPTQQLPPRENLTQTTSNGAPSPINQLPPNKKTRNLKFIAGIIIFLLISIGAVGFYLYKQQSPEQIACTMEAKACPDGSSVGRTGPNCEFAPCPKITPTPTDIGEKLGKFYWNIKNSKLSNVSENEIKNVLRNYSPENIYSGSSAQLTLIQISTLSANFVILTGVGLDKNLQTIPSEPFEYILEKSNTWKIVNASDKEFCSILKKLPDDLLGSRREYYFNCFSN